MNGKSWKKAIVLGGGASAKAFDFAELRLLGLLLGVNRAALHAPCDAVFSLDRPFILHHRDALAAYPGEVHVCLGLGFQDMTPCGAVFWRRVADEPPRVEDKAISSGAIGAGNSGLAALNLCAHMGSERIVLVGFDMDEANRDWYGRNYGPRPTREKVLRNFRATAPWYGERGIAIVNANPASSIRCFPRMPADEAMAWLSG